MPRPFDDDPGERVDPPPSFWRPYMQPGEKNEFRREDGDYGCSEPEFATRARAAAARHKVRVRINYSKANGYVRVTVLGPRDGQA